MIRHIRENLVVLINPVSNPDGRDKQVEWFYRYLKGKTDRDTLPRQPPPYWGNHVFVDINRDTHQQTQETPKLSTACSTRGIPPWFTIFMKPFHS